MKKITIRLPEWIAARLKVEADRMGLSVNALMTQISYEFIKELPEEKNGGENRGSEQQ